MITKRKPVAKRGRKVTAAPKPEAARAAAPAPQPAAAKPGRPEYQPTPKEREQVKSLAGLGIQQFEIAKVIGLSEPTLRKHFWHELELGGVVANAAVAQSLFKMATDKTKPNVAAAIFWLKTRANWSEAQPIDPGKKAAANELAGHAERGSQWDGVLQ